jgi:hypothetical protein
MPPCKTEKDKNGFIICAYGFTMCYDCPHKERPVQLAPLRKVIDTEDLPNRMVSLRLECGHAKVQKSFWRSKRVRCPQCFMQNVTAPIIQKAF